MKVSEIQQLPPKFLVLGKPGTGKTALTATGGKAVQVLDLDRGILTALTFKDKWFDERQKIDVITCYEDQGPTAAVAFRKAKEHIYSVSTMCAKGTYPYKVYVVDSLTSLGEAALRMIRVSSGKWGLAPQLDTRKGLTQPEWGLAINEMVQVVSVLRNLPIAVIVLGHVTEVADKFHPETGQLIRPGYLSPNVIGQKLPETLPAYFDEIIYAQTNVIQGNQLEYELRTKKMPGIDFLRTRAQIPDHTKINAGLRELLRLARYDLDLAEAQQAQKPEEVKPTVPAPSK
jgi:hypothetical protein